jgi:3'(2'), 5'-bisphosphate nucleotidase
MDFLPTVIDAALRAGDAILRIYERDFDVARKADESPLTEADKAAHHIIVDALADTGLPVLSEESEEVSYEKRRSWSRFWRVDPLDGTKEFIKKNGEFTVNIALIENGRPVLGVVYAPVLQTVYYGVQADNGEHGAWRADNCAGKPVSEIFNSAISLPLSSDLCPPSSDLRVVASRSHCNEETKTFIADLEEAYGAVELVSSGSSLKLCMAAEGSADIYPRIAPTMEWDTAAAQAVVEAAGGRVVKYDAAVPAATYLTHDAGSRERSDCNGEGSSRHAPCAMPHAPCPVLHALCYNKPDLLNPHFVVSRM